MQGTFLDIIRGSWEWTKTVLFRPFIFKKWIFLCVIALLSAEFSSFNININIPSEKPRQEIIKTQEPAGISATQAPPLNIKKSVWLVPIIIPILVIALIIFIFFLWLYSRFSFIFLNSVIRNDASIKIPFRENKSLGNSFFKWNTLFLIATISVFLLMILILIRGINFLQAIHIIWKILLAMLWGLLFFCIILIIAIIHVTAHDIVLPIMFKDKIGIKRGWQEALKIIKREKQNFTIYLLIKIGIRIVTGILAGLFTVAVMFALLIQLGIIGGVLYSISFVIPEILRWGYYAFIILLGIISLIAIIFLINLALLPVPIFFRTYSLKFLARIDDRYDLFRLA